jgi:hypothetical protein
VIIGGDLLEHTTVARVLLNPLGGAVPVLRVLAHEP